MFSVKQKNALRLLLPAVIAFGLFFYLQHPAFFEKKVAPLTLNEISTASSSIAVIDNPLVLIIPKINLKTKVQHVGQTWNGNMAVPNNFTDVGWYKYGTLPGAVGNAVIDGHVDNALGLSAVFKNLTMLTAGDLIYVENASGTRTTFKVITKEVYEYNHAPLQKIFGTTTKRALNLITCSGTWLSVDRTDSHRLVVYTEAVI